MKKILIPLLLMIVGTAAGGGVGYFLMADPESEALAEHTAENPCGDVDMETTLAAAPPQPVPLEEREYARMNNQFVVPVIIDEKVAALMVMSLSLEVEVGGQEAVFAHEPRLRDAFLQVMFDHANMGGFNGAFTATSNMRLLRERLQEAADEIMRGHISDILILDIVRQDVTN